MTPTFWLLVGTAFLALELMVPGHFMIFFAVGATAGAVAAALGAGAVAVEFAALSLGTVVAALLGNRLYRSLLRRHSTAAEALDQGRFMVGLTGTIERALTGGTGRVRVGDTTWLCRGAALPEGAVVRVVGMEGTVLLVAATGPDHPA